LLDNEYLRSLGRLPATIAGGPVDAVNGVLGMLGAPVSQNPVMGSQWIAQNTGMPQQAGNPMIDNILSMLGPQDVAAIAAKLGVALKSAGALGIGMGTIGKPDIRAVVRFGGQEFDGANHIEAMKKAADAGMLDLSNPKLNRAMGDSIDLFRTPEGKLITRDEAGTMYGGKRSEDLPQPTYDVQELPPEAWPQ
jgi:hypothetical protein